MLLRDLELYFLVSKSDICACFRACTPQYANPPNNPINP